MERNLLIPAFILYILAAAVYLLRYRKTGMSLFGAGALLNFAAVGYRWIDAGHLPFSNMFETMMTLGACMFLLFLLTEFGFRSRTGWIEALLAAVIVLPSLARPAKRVKAPGVGPSLFDTSSSSAFQPRGRQARCWRLILQALSCSFGDAGCSPLTSCVTRQALEAKIATAPGTLRLEIGDLTLRKSLLVKRFGF